MVGGGGERVTLRIVAEYATISNWFGDPEEAARKGRVLDGWCEQVGRNSKEVERSVPIHPARLEDAEAYVERGFTHLIVGFSGATDDLSPLRELVA